MDQFSHDLTIALEETSLLDRARVSRWGQQRRRTRSTGNLPCAPQPTEDSSSPTELVFGHAAGPQSHATNSYDGLDTQNICLPSDSDDDDDDRDDENSLPRLACNKSTLSVAAIRLGTLESDSLNETFSPSRFFKPTTSRRKRKFKRISMYYDIMASVTPDDNEEKGMVEVKSEKTNTSNIYSNHQVTSTPSTVMGTTGSPSIKDPALISPLTPATSIVAGDSKTTVSPLAEAGGIPMAATLRKRGLKPEPMAVSSGGSSGGGGGCRAQLLFCGKRKRLNRDRCLQEHYQDHSFSMPRYYTYLEEYRMRPRSFSSTSKPHSDRLLPLNKGLLSKIERIAQQQQEQQQQQQQHQEQHLKKKELLKDHDEEDEEKHDMCHPDSDDTSEEDSIKRKNIEVNLLNEDIDLETEDQLRSVENKSERRRRSKKVPREQPGDKTEVAMMMMIDTPEPKSESTPIAVRKAPLERLESPDNQQTALPGLENQFANYRIYRKKRFNDSNSNFYYTITDNVSKQNLHHHHHPHHHRQLQQRSSSRKGYQTSFYRDTAGILQFSIDSPLQHFHQQQQQQHQHQQEGFAAMDCGDLNEFSSSSSLSSSSDSESGLPSVNDTDRDGDDELTDCPGNENMCGNGLGKYEMKRKLLKRSTLPQIKSDPESSSAILTGEDDTIMSGSSTLGSGGGGSGGGGSGGVGGLTTTTTTSSNHLNSLNFEQRSLFPCSEPITIASTTRPPALTCVEEGLQLTHPESNNILYAGGSICMATTTTTPQPPPPPTLPQLKSLSSTASSSNASSCNTTSPGERREMRAGCRRLKMDRPSFSIRTSLNARLSRFLQNPQQLQMRLPDIESGEQDSLTNLANLYSLQMSLDNGCTVLNKTSNTTQMVNVEEPDLMSGAGHSLLQDYKRRCYENKDNNDLFHK